MFFPVTDENKETLPMLAQKKPMLLNESSEPVLFITPHQIKQLCESVQLHAIIRNEKDGSITVALQELDLVTNRATTEHAIYALAEDLIDYALEYYAEFELYYQSPNRKNHFPFVMKVLMQSDLDDIIQMIQIK